MLAVVFWNARRKSVSARQYGDSVRRFHEELNSSKPSGFRFSTTFIVETLPWFSPQTEIYEDWYVMTNFAGMDSLDAAILDGRRLPAHKELMTTASSAFGGIYYLKNGGARMDQYVYAHWLARPPDRTAEVIAEQAKRGSAKLRCSAWTRAMALGPHEYCLLGNERIDALKGSEVTSVERQLFWSPTSG